MSSPSSIGTRTPAASQATGCTDYSPENLCFDSVSLITGHGVALPNNHPNSYELLGSSHLQGAIDTVQTTPRKGHPGRLSSSHSSSSTDPFSGTTDKDELSSCFLCISGRQDLLFEFQGGGKFEFLLKLTSYDDIHYTDKGARVFLHYQDRRDAQDALQFIRGQPSTRYANIEAISITAADYCYSSRNTRNIKQLSELGRTFVTGNDGQMIFTAQPPNGVQINERIIAYAKDKLDTLIGGIADIYRFVVTGVDNSSNYINFLVELYEPKKADEVIKLFRNIPDLQLVESMRVRCCLLGEEKLGRTAPTSLQSRRTAPSWRSEMNLDNISTRPTLSSRPSYGVIGDKRPVNGRKDSFDFQPANGDSFSFLHDYRFSRDSRSRENKNYIDLTRVKHGLDVRTTVMLRNIPNRYTHNMLKEVLDETVHGKYDFLYLRIDFANNCNVGYAFINFMHPNWVATFVEAVAGKKWNYSDKVAEVSYATMQGRETLVQKFRNSSVMNEDSGSRPKLYRTHPDPEAGEEEEFPAPDNLFKLARSNQNAAHIGLFSPNRGGPAHLADRHRHGRFDRGTSFALLERMMAENAMLRGMHGLASTHPFY